MKAKVHKNLSRGDWSVTVKSTNKVQPASSVLCHGIKFKQPSGKQFEACLAGAKRKVFAYIHSESTTIDAPQPDLSGWQRVFFNPRKGHRFFQLSDGTRVDSATEAYFTESSEMWIR